MAFAFRPRRTLLRHSSSRRSCLIGQFRSPDGGARAPESGMTSRVSRIPLRCIRATTAALNPSSLLGKSASRFHFARMRHLAHLPLRTWIVRRSPGAPFAAARGRRKGRAAVARTMRASSQSVHGCAVCEPRSPRAHLQGMDARKARRSGCVSLVTFFAQAKKVTRSAAGRVEAVACQRGQLQQELDSSLTSSAVEELLAGMTNSKNNTIPTQPSP